MSEPIVDKKKKERSPTYPSMPLETAIANVKVLWERDKKSAMSLPVIASHTGSSAKSSGFLQLVSTIKQFGLLEELEGQGERKLKLTNRAIDIAMLPPDNPLSLAAVKAAALEPKIHKELWEEFQRDGVPSDIGLQHRLVTEKKFQVAAAVDLIKCFKKTIAFARLAEADKILPANPAKTPAVGDWVQWEPQGVAQFPEPRRLTAIDSGWGFVAESLTGMPMEEVRKVDAPEGQGAAVQQPSNDPGASETGGMRMPPVNPNFKPPAAPTPPTPGYKQATVPTGAGDALIRWPSVLTQSEFEDLEAWLDMMKRTIKRSVTAESPQN